MDYVGTLAALIAFVFAIVLAICWVILPFIIIAKFNELIRLQKKANETLDVLQHQWTVILRANLPAEQ
jgi:uncharacterized membrane protein YciS (DUF1049 family)